MSKPPNDILEYDDFDLLKDVDKYGKSSLLAALDSDDPLQIKNGICHDIVSSVEAMKIVLSDKYRSKMDPKCYELLRYVFYRLRSLQEFCFVVPRIEYYKPGDEIPLEELNKGIRHRAEKARILADNLAEALAEAERKTLADPKSRIQQQIYAKVSDPSRPSQN